MGQRSDLGHNVSMGRPDDIRLSFNEAAEIYDRIRPAYPADLFDALFQMLRSEPEIVEALRSRIQSNPAGQCLRDAV